LRHPWMAAIAAAALTTTLVSTGSTVAADGNGGTATPIKHVIVVIGENHTFDNVFATYRPKDHQQVLNLLSEGIVNPDGTPGPAARGMQQTATSTSAYSLAPTQTGPYPTLPQPSTTTGFQPFNSPDPRFPANLPNAPFQITKYVPYTAAFVGDPIHRFYQMWQQIDQGKNDLFVWTGNTAGKDNGAIPPGPISQGGVSMGYYNVNQGDAPFLKQWADQYALADNYHQSAMGGTGVNHVMLGMADDVYFSDGHGNAAVPPVNQIENPNPKPGTNNNFTQDGYAGGSYTNCSDATQPGVQPIDAFLSSGGRQPFNSCAPGHYYLLNNYNPGYNEDGTVATSSPFTVPPSSVPTIADELSARKVSWGYFGEGFNNGHPDPAYCNICNPFQYSTSIMTNPSLRKNLQGMPDFFQQVAAGTLPAVSYVKPNGLNDGHPASSQLAAFEDYTQNIVNSVKANRNLWKDTAIVVTMDEGGGYYDSGYVQPLNFFGDGTRIPTIAISPWARPGFVDHTYYDHVSVVKFIEKNWHLSPLSNRSLDRLPNPKASSTNPYVPTNGPAIGDLMKLFDFHHDHEDG
jgi:acid phosphatase